MGKVDTEFLQMLCYPSEIVYCRLSSYYVPLSLQNMAHCLLCISYLTSKINAADDWNKKLLLLPMIYM